MSHSVILWRKITSVTFIYYKRMYTKQLHLYNKIFQWPSSDSIYLDTLLFWHPFTSAPIINDKRVPRFCGKRQYKFFIITFSINVSVFFSPAAKQILLTIMKFFKGKLSPNEIVKPFCRSAVVLKLKICFTPSLTVTC